MEDAGKMQILLVWAAWLQVSEKPAISDTCRQIGSIDHAGIHLCACAHPPPQASPQHLTDEISV